MYDDEKSEGTRHDKHVPNHVRALTHYFHSLTEIYEYYRGFGNEMPPVFKLEIKRAEQELSDSLHDETNQGGALREFYDALTPAERKQIDDSARKR